jgi:G:T-mismatch repair DNA endonuclease (very short patch repair protein)
VEGDAVALRRSFTKQSRKFWVKKITNNVHRDLRQIRVLRRNGWAVLRLWEREVLRAPIAAAAIVLDRVVARRRYLKRRQGGA